MSLVGEKPSSRSLCLSRLESRDTVAKQLVGLSSGGGGHECKEETGYKRIRDKNSRGADKKDPGCLRARKRTFPFSSGV